MRKIFLYKGYHNSSVREFVTRTWENDDLLIFCPPDLKEADFFLPHLPPGSVELIGEWIHEPILNNTSTVSAYPAQPVFGVFTTGTTRAKPKLVLYSKENLKSSIKGVYSFFSDLRIKTIYCYPQPYHVFGLTLGYVAALLLEHDLITSQGKYTDEHHKEWLKAARLFGDHLITLGTPTHFKDLITYTTRNTIEVAPSLTSIAGGARVEVALWHQMQEKLKIKAPSIGYGCTEAAPGVTHLSPGDAPTEEGAIGVAVPGIDIALKDDNGATISGPSLCLAMIENDKVTFPQSFLLCDRLQKDSRGNYRYLGRTQLTLNRGGEKFPLEEIEATIKARLGLDIICLAKEEARLGEELGIVLQCAQSSESAKNKERLYAALSELYGRNFSQHLFVVVSKFPRNMNHKIDRKACRKILESIGKLQFPLPVSFLQDWLPHRAPMVWVDKVMWVNDEEGECLVNLDRSAHYYDQDGIRSSSFIEWMAQSQGFIGAARTLSRISGQGFVANLPPTKAFLAAVSDVAMAEEIGENDDQLLVHVKLVRDLNPLSLIEAQVTSLDKTKTFARAKLKVFTA